MSLPCRLGTRLGWLAALAAAAGPLPAAGQDPPVIEGRQLEVRPAEFVGNVNDCADGYPAGARFVQAAWLRGIGLPDNGGPNANPADPRDNPNKEDPHFGLLLAKNGPTPDCSAATARLVGFDAGDTLRELGWDYLKGSHCGAGAPRFNVRTVSSFLYFVGCFHGDKTPAPQYPAEWTRVRFNDSDFFPQFASQPPFRMGITPVQRISIVVDEGPDTPLPESPSGPGLIVLDNITVNGEVVRAPR
jgi:hypothetical protein